MEYRFLGSSGLKISALSFGAWVTFSDQINEKVASENMKTAFDAGVNFFDNAEIYANGNAEKMMGNILKRFAWKRSDYLVSTKIFWGGSGPNDRGLSRKHIIEGTDAALKRLQLEYVDLIFCHRPDPDTPIEETVRAMNHIINQGKAFYWGTSEWGAPQIVEAYHVARANNLIPPTMEQPQYNMFHRDKVEREFLKLYGDIGLGTTVWSPLASGLLSGKYQDGTPEGTRISLKNYGWLKERFESEEGRIQLIKVNRLLPIAGELGLTLPQLAIAWCLKNPNVSSVITGASKVEQVRENMKAVEAVSSLTTEVMEKLDSVLDNRPKVEINLRNV